MRYIQNKKGLTLVEILAVIVILAIVSAILFNLLTSSNKEYKSQVDDTTNLNELSFIMKEITRDFRKTLNGAVIDSNSNTVTFKTNENGQEKIIAIYTKTGDTLSKNGLPYQTKIRSFCVQSTEEPSIGTQDCMNNAANKEKTSKGIYVNIENTNGKRVETTLYSRGG